MNPLRSAKQAILKPEFVFRPTQLLRRLSWKHRWLGRAGKAELPWGLPIGIDATETIGMAISKLGVYDLIVPEAILRLAGTGETALDVGANIGMNTGALALAVGPSGRVIAYEPHPTLSRGLQDTIDTWRGAHGIANIELRQLAVSDHAGTATLQIPIGFDQNVGSASLSEATAEPGEKAEMIQVQVVSLDEEFPAAEDRIGVMKIDIEGHEIAALRGAERLLSVGCIRDIIFEEHAPLPTAVSQLLESHGYHVFLLRKDTLGPKLVPTPCELPPALPNYLATLDPERAQRRFKKRGFLALKRHPAQKR